MTARGGHRPDARDATPAAIESARRFALGRWAYVQRERGSVPTGDLTNACRYAALFSQALFGGSIRANWYHVWNELPDGTPFDLTDGVQFRTGIPADLELRARRIGLHVADPLRDHDERVFRESEFRAGLSSCYATVREWVRVYLGDPAWDWPEGWDWGW